jgi:hypothetical protein
MKYGALIGNTKDQLKTPHHIGIVFSFSRDETTAQKSSQDNKVQPPPSLKIHRLGWLSPKRLT